MWFVLFTLGFTAWRMVLAVAYLLFGPPLDVETLLEAAVFPHVRGGAGARDVSLASLDHAMWFHRPFRADEWLLYVQESPNAGGGRGLASGRLYRDDGTLVASVVQEGLIRRRELP